jgi:hypothetical protein
VTRTALTLSLFAGLSLWASAQERTTQLYQHLKQFEANRLLLDQLINHGLNLSKGGDSLGRAEECRQAAITLAAALKTVPRNDAERVAELSDHIAAVVRDGLVPNLTDAHAQVGSPEQRQKLADISRDARTDLSELDKSLPHGEVFDRSASLASARQKLTDAQQKLAEVSDRITTPRK